MNTESEKLAELAAIFAIRICAYGVLSNHFHLVVRIDSGRARAWSDTEVIERTGGCVAARSSRGIGPRGAGSRNGAPRRHRKGDSVF